MNVISDNQFAHERFHRAARHRNIRAFEQRQHPQHVAQGLLRRLVAGGRGDRFHFQFRGGEGENEGDRVIMTRIAINNNGQCHCGSL
ncbi:Uncharacterised protein [Salmonella enterica subsp. enterica serovar Bovismorbificans]|uniref:Uncharacterized protein n=1 Tax=Salmonella enterica subsp. enterica serovar Bovismorbificans TaxID=58097 RepID=A0A655BT39_SALET|nr:Uncharacterised protein [Salmonella enterica subsp. enterica serovar Bovismorbificans]CPR55277.1 Uncharacterised protein [Salmonella enterica subsp. enterica serovar Bovismorbificans]